MIKLIINKVKSKLVKPNVVVTNKTTFLFLRFIIIMISNSYKDIKKSQTTKSFFNLFI